MTPQTTRIIRYSTQGFKSQCKSKHMKNIDYHLNYFNINDFLEHLRHIIQKQHEEHFLFTKHTIKTFNMEYGFLYRDIKITSLSIT